MDDALPNPTISYYRIVYVDGYAYASGPTGTGIFPAGFDVRVDWASWSPFAGWKPNG